MAGYFPIEILEALRVRGKKPALVVGTGVLSGEMVRGAVLGVARQLRQRGVGPGSRVVVVSNNGPRGLVLALAIAALGGVVVPWSPILPAGEIGVTHLFHIGPLPPGLHFSAAEPVGEDWMREEPADPAGLPGYASENDICFVTSSSGTTGQPKFLDRPVALVGSKMAGGTQLGGRTLAMLHETLSYPGFMAALIVLRHGVLCLPQSGQSGPDEVLRMGATRIDLVFGSPAQVAAWLGPEPLKRKLLAIWTSGAPMTPALVRRFRKQASFIASVYGSTEGAINARAMIVAPLPGRSRLRYTPDRDCEIQVVDEADRLVPRGTEGEIRGRSRFMSTGYIGSTGDADGTYRDGWFYPGDRGILHRDGSLEVVGRSRDTLNLGGVKLNAGLIDAAAAEVAGVETAMCFERESPTGETRLGLVVVTRAGADRRKVAEALHQNLLPVVRTRYALPTIGFIDQLPLGPAGKPLRAAGEALLGRAELAQI